MLGSGHKPPKRELLLPGTEDADVEWVTLDINPDCKPTIRMNLSLIEHTSFIPEPTASFDEIHAYHVLEHYGRQGNYTGFFRGMGELWRLLKPGGYLVAVVPHHESKWAWGDPGHTRVINSGTVAFLSKDMQAMGDSRMTDYSHLIAPCWWKIIHSEEKGEDYSFVLQKMAV